MEKQFEVDKEILDAMKEVKDESVFANNGARRIGKTHRLDEIKKELESPNISAKKVKKISKEVSKTYANHDIGNAMEIAQIIHQRHRLRVPQGKISIAISYFNMMLPFIVEGKLDDDLKKIQHLN